MHMKLYYLRARYADPDRGRFWTQDSFEGFGTDPHLVQEHGELAQRGIIAAAHGRKTYARPLADAHD